MSYRAAALGSPGGDDAVVAVLGRDGDAVVDRVLFFLIYLALALAITRMRPELGTPIHDLHFTGPDWVLVGSRRHAAASRRRRSPRSAFSSGSTGPTAATPMPHQLEGFKLAERHRTSQRRWFWALHAGARSSAPLAGFWAMLHSNYHYGATAKARHLRHRRHTAAGWLAAVAAPPQHARPAGDGGRLCNRPVPAVDAGRASRGGRFTRWVRGDE